MWSGPEAKVSMEGRSADQQVTEDLVRRAQGGEQSAFGELYELFYDQIFRYITFKCGSRLEAEDLTGEVFVKMLESIGKFKFQGFPFTSWLYRIAHNVVVDHFRRKGRRPTVPLDTVLNAAGAGESELERHVQVNLSMVQLTEALDDLTELQREVISLRFASGLSVAETARAVGRKENAVKALQHAGIRKLRRILAPPEAVVAAGSEADS